LLVDSVESMMMHGLANPKSHCTVCTPTKDSCLSVSEEEDNV